MANVPEYVFHLESFISCISASLDSMVAIGQLGGTCSILDLISKKVLHSWGEQNSASILAVGMFKGGLWLQTRLDSRLCLYGLCETSSTGLQLTLKETLLLHYSGFCAVSEISHENRLIIAVPLNESDISLFAIVQNDDLHLVSLLTLKSDYCSVGGGSSTKLGYYTCINLFSDAASLKLLTCFESGHCRMWRIESNDSTTFELDTRKIFSSAIFASQFFAPQTLKAEQWSTHCCASLDKIAVTKLEDSVNTLSSKYVVVPGETQLTSLAIGRSGKLLAVGLQNGDIRIISLKKLTDLAFLKYHRESITALKMVSLNMSAAGQTKETHLIAGSGDGSLSIWRLYKDSVS